MSVRRVALAVTTAYLLYFVYVLYKYNPDYSAFLTKLSVLVFTGVAIFFGSIYFRERKLKELGLVKFYTPAGELRWGTPDEARKQEVVKEIVKVISEYEPPTTYNRETRYKDSLYGWLKAHFPKTYMEKQRGSSRPDLVVEKDGVSVAIEIKGPTDYNGLKSIPDKVMRYRNYFDAIVVVLFDLEVSDSYYEEWRDSLKKTFPDVTIVRFD